MLKKIGTGLAFLLIGVGLILFPMPVPFGIFFILGGIALLNAVNPSRARRLSKWLSGVTGVNLLRAKAEAE